MSARFKSVKRCATVDLPKDLIASQLSQVLQQKIYSNYRTVQGHFLQRDTFDRGSVPNSGRKDGARHENPPVVPNIMLIVGIICGVLVLGLVIHIAGRSVQQLNFVPKCLRRYNFTFDRFHMKSRCRVKHQAPKKRKQESANWSPQGDTKLCRLSGSIKVWNLIHFMKWVLS